MDFFRILINSYIPILLLILLFLTYQSHKKNPVKHNTESTTTDNNVNQQTTLNQINTYKYLPYAKGHLLTKTEHVFFITLVREALKRRLLVCPKVRLEDIIFVTDYRNKLKYRGYIKSRHVDFVILNKFCETVAAIELDDPSHNTAKAKEIDQFKNELFAKVGIPLIRIKTGVNYIEELNIKFDLLNFPKSELKKTQP